MDLIIVLCQVMLDSGPSMKEAKILADRHTICYSNNNCFEALKIKWLDTEIVEIVNENGCFYKQKDSK